MAREFVEERTGPSLVLEQQRKGRTVIDGQSFPFAVLDSGFGRLTFSLQEAVPVINSVN